MWQDKIVKFDVSLPQLELGLGEVLIDKLDMIEDAKGNAGDRGRLMVTNLRIMWHSVAYPRVNLTIGYLTFMNVTTKIINSVRGGTRQALYILSTYDSCKYEFLFVNLDRKSTRHFTSVMGVHKAYNTSKMFRDLKLRVGIIKDKRLVLLPNEFINITLRGVWNLSSEQGNVGTFIVTNIRFVWYADMNHQFNVSMPYLTVSSIKVRSSKFGETLVVTSTELSGSYILGFKVDPIDKLHNLHTELLMQFEVSKKSPIYGVDYVVEVPSASCEQNTASIRGDRDIEPPEEISNVYNAYFSEGGGVQGKPTYNASLGLAIEEPKQGVTLESLWELHPKNKK